MLGKRETRGERETDTETDRQTDRRREANTQIKCLNFIRNQLRNRALFVLTQTIVTRLCTDVHITLRRFLADMCNNAFCHRQLAGFFSQVSERTTFTSTIRGKVIKQ